MRRRTELRGRAARLARLLPAGPSRAARTPFVLLVVLLLGGGLITLLMLNSSLNEGSFELGRLKKETTDLTDEEQALQREVSGYEDPGALERRARDLGMVPGGAPAFLAPDGTVRGVPSPAAPPPAPTAGTPGNTTPRPGASAATPGGTDPGASGAAGTGQASPSRSAPAESPTSSPNQAR